MIIFFNKKTGAIVGHIQGRFHTDHMNMWLGNKKETDRIVVEWIPNGKERVEVQESVDFEDVGTDETGEAIYKKVTKKEDIVIKEIEPDTEQKDLFIKLDQDPMAWHDFKVEVKTKKLIPNG